MVDVGSARAGGCCGWAIALDAFHRALCGLQRVGVLERSRQRVACPLRLAQRCVALTVEAGVQFVQGGHAMLELADHPHRLLGQLEHRTPGLLGWKL